MRLRKLHNASEILNNYPQFFIANPTLLASQWGKTFGNDNPIFLEIGMGKGQFIMKNAIAFPEINFLGIELNETICAKAVKKFTSSDEKLSNLRIINFDARQLTTIFASHSISQIFLNFSDPWPKKRHTKNRLTSPNFLDIYKQILKPDAKIILKTDNDGLFAYTMEVIKERKDIKVLYATTDLYADIDNPCNQQNIATEYEERFVALNKNINKVIFCFK